MSNQTTVNIDLSRKLSKDETQLVFKTVDYMTIEGTKLKDWKDVSFDEMTDEIGDLIELFKTMGVTMNGFVDDRDDEDEGVMVDTRKK